VVGEEGDVDRLYWGIEKDLPGEGMDFRKDTNKVKYAGV
jgi:hypothetical protein